MKVWHCFLKKKINFYEVATFSTNDSLTNIHSCYIHFYLFYSFLTYIFSKNLIEFVLYFIISHDFPCLVIIIVLYCLIVQRNPFLQILILPQSLPIYQILFEFIILSTNRKRSVMHYECKMLFICLESTALINFIYSAFFLFML